MMATKEFPVRTVLSVTTGRLLTRRRGPDDNGIGDLYDLLGWMTDDSPFTHQLPRFSGECAPWLLLWFPELEAVRLPDLDAKLAAMPAEEAVESWLASLDGIKPAYAVPKIPRDDHDTIDPLEELKGMVSPGTEIIVVD